MYSQYSNAVNYHDECTDDVSFISHINATQRNEDLFGTRWRTGPPSKSARIDKNL